MVTIPLQLLQGRTPHGNLILYGRIARCGGGSFGRVPASLRLWQRRILLGYLTDVSSRIPSRTFHRNWNGCNLTVLETNAWHAHLAKTPLLQSDPILSDRLADSYCKLGAFDEAFHLLGEISHPNPTLWNLVISGYNSKSRYDGSFRTFSQMRYSGLKPTQFTYGSILSACSASENIKFGNQVHCLVVKNCFLWDAYVTNGMIDLFVKNNYFDEALQLFFEIPSVENVVCWNAIIAGAVRNGEYWVALDLFRKMIDDSCLPNGFTFSSVLTACTAVGHLEVGVGIHGWVAKCGVQDDIFVGTGIVDLYAKCGDIDNALKQFSLMTFHNVVSWTSIISGLIQREEHPRALQLFKDMRQKNVVMNEYTVTSVLVACAKPGMVKEVGQIHCLIFKSGLSSYAAVRDALISAYAKTGNVQISEKVFKEMGIVKHLNSWVAIIAGFAQNQKITRSIEFFQRMLQEGFKPDEFCSSAILSVVNCVDLGKQIHSYVLKSNLLPFVCVGCALLAMYSTCGYLNDSYCVFSQMLERDRVTWTSMIAGFADHGYVAEAIQLFHEMFIDGITPDNMTFAVILSACSTAQSLMKGKETHGHTLRAGLLPDRLLDGALVTMYSKCKAIKSAVRVFNQLSQKDQSSWSALISGYDQNGYSAEAIFTFSQMMADGFQVDHFTMCSALGASGNLSSHTCGKNLHALSQKTGLHCYLPVSSAIVTMYSKSGNIDDSHRIFNQIEAPDLVTWTAMIDSYALHGNGKGALEIYKEMIKSGIKPDSVTFVGVLSACSHNGLVEEGFLHFNSMTTTYGIVPEACHYACMVDLLCRCGRLKEAVRFIERMPIEANLLMWSTLLAACRLHGDFELGRKAAEQILDLGPSDSGTFISLSNICAEQGEWEKVARVRKLMKGVGVKKEPGWSSM